MKNIFYCSNAHKELFSNNTRSNFNSYIDISDLNYLHDDDDIEATIKSITFDNKESFKIKLDRKRPHFIIKQKLWLVSQPEFTRFFEEEDDDTTNYTKPFRINFYEAKDYICSYTDLGLAVSKKHNGGTFSNIQIMTREYVMHNIYLHDVEIFSASELINHLNNVLKNVSFNFDDLKINSNLKEKGEQTYLNPVEYEVFVKGELGDLLNLDDTNIKKMIGSSWRDMMNGWIEKRDFPRRHPCFYPDYNLDSKQYMKYYAIPFDMKPAKIQIDFFKTDGVLYGIRSNISDPTIRNNSYDNIISLFVGNNTNDVEHVQFRNPPFFNTRKELLSRAQFQIVDVNTNLHPNFSTGSPTYIQVVIRKSVPRMKKPFNIFLDSSCPKSKALYPKNNSMEFTIDLPERLSFNRHWQVTLKSLFIPNKILHLDDCYIKYYYYNWSMFGSLENRILSVGTNHHSTIDSFLHQFNRVLELYQIKIRGEIFDGKVVLEYYEDWKEWQFSNSLFLSPHLAHILGFQKYDASNTEFVAKFNKTSTQDALYEPDLFFMYPKNLIIGCDVVDDTIFGGEHVKLLRLVTNNVHVDGDILSFDFLQNEYVDLNVKEFKSIKIGILDASGGPVKTHTSFPTRLQLMFSSI